MITNNLNDSAKWKYLKDLISNFCEVYNYKYLKNDCTNLENINKYYTLVENNNKTLLKVTAKGKDNSLILSELISFIYRLFEELGLEDTIININDDKIANILQFLDINYSLNSNNENIYGAYNDVVIATIDNNIAEIVLDDILEYIENPMLTNGQIEVFIIGESEEEKIKALELSQNLRLSGVITELDLNNLAKDEQLKIANDFSPKFIVKLDNEDLQKGLIIVKDAILNEEFKIDENEILEYLLSNI